MTSTAPPSPYALLLETPAPDEYRALRVQAGLSPKSAEGAAVGLPNTFFAVTIRIGPELVGMGRIVGDGGLTFQIVDIAVHPAHQHRGLGKAIVARLVEHIHQVAPAGAHTSLLADVPADRLYAQFGFEPIGDLIIGMHLPIP